MTAPERWFHERATQYVTAQLFFHLGQSGVFGLLADGEPHSASELAVDLGLDSEVLDLLLDYLSAVDPVLERASDGAYLLSQFGLEVVDRYGQHKGDALELNLFNVRVGAYGPVWEGVGALLRGEARYGDGVLRKGDESAEALRTICVRMLPGLGGLIDAIAPGRLVEVGVTTGLLEGIASERPEIQCFGLDRAAEALEGAAVRWTAAGGSSAHWIRADVFDVDAWASALAEGPPGVLFSVHFHELLAGGDDRFVQLLRDLGHSLPGWRIIALEQPRPERGAQPTDKVQHLYAWSNVLIHHLIGNGRILSSAEWQALFERGGCRVAAPTALNYLGYEAYVAELGARNL